MRNFSCTIAIGLFLLLLGPSAFADLHAVVHLANGRTETVTVDSARFENRNMAYLRGRAGDRTVEFKAPEIWMIQFDNAPIPPTSDEFLWFEDGTRLSGRLESGSMRQAIPYAERSDLFPQLVMRNEWLTGVTRGTPPPARLNVGVKDNDVLWTCDGDRMVGRFLRIDDGLVVFRSSLGTLQIPRHRMQALSLNHQSLPKPDQPTWLLEFANGDRVWTSLWSMEGNDQLACKIGATRRVANLQFLTRAINVGENVSLLSRRRPDRFAMNSRLKGTEAILVDRGPGDIPLRVGDREYGFGLFLRPDCSMEYDLAREAEFFRAELGISTQLAREGVARVIIQAGDRPPTSHRLVSGEKPIFITAELKDMKQLRIEVQADDPWGCGAHVIIGEPVLIGEEQWLANRNPASSDNRQAGTQ